MSANKTLSQLRDELGRSKWNECKSKGYRPDHAESFDAGFDAGAQAVMAEAQALAEALEHYQSAHYDHKNEACYGDKTEEQALARWDAFKQGDE